MLKVNAYARLKAAVKLFHLPEYAAA